jgi:sodium/proline symporter
MDQTFLIAFGSYIAVLAGIITYFYKKSSSGNEFALGNRSLNYLATAIAAHSSDMSIWLFMGFPGAIYLSGMQKIWIPIGLITGMYCSWTFVAKKLRIATATTSSITLSHYFEKRFNDKTGLLRAISALLALLFFLFYISSGLVGMGIMFESVFGLNYHLGVLIGLLTAVFYTLIGGFVGVAWADLFQGLFLVVMIVMVPVFGYYLLPNGFETVSTVAQLKNISLNLIPETFNELMSCLLLAVGWGLGYLGQPHILVNFMGIKNAQEITKAKYIGMTWQLFTLAASVAVGLIGIGIFAQGLTNPELVFVEMVQTLFSPFFAGFVLCAIIAAGLTTVDTQILVSASIFSEDIYKRYFNPKATAQETLLISRLGVIIVPLISYIIAFSKSASVFGLVDYAWSGLGSCFGPVVITSLYSKSATKNGALFGMLAGGLVAALWPITGSTVPAMIPGFFINLALILLIK